VAPTVGFEVSDSEINPKLFPFQIDLTAWALKKGRAALFADTGLGKTAMQLVWADRIVRETNGNVLVLTPLAVSPQTVREGAKFGIAAHQSRDGCVHRGITVANYESLHHFTPSDFQGIVCDESAILKSFDGVRRKAITRFMRQVPYRLLCSATPAPNDYTEMGTSSEALGYLGHTDMLNRFFVNDRNNSASGRMYGKMAEWRLKGHAERSFWQWVTSWARSIRKPSDLGYSDDGFDLPPLIERQIIVDSLSAPDGMLFAIEAVRLDEQRAERRRTLQERCEKVAELVAHDKAALVWCHLNDESRLLKRLIPDAIEVTGYESDQVKEEKLLSFANQQVRVLITKPRIAGWGLNFQHCAHITIFPSHSFEQYYQAIRRCWRYGQTSPVIVDVIATEGERRVLRNLQAKQVKAEKIFTLITEMMNDSLSLQRNDIFTTLERIPSWL